MSEAKVVPPRPPAVENNPLFAGRFITAAAMLVGLGVVANPVFNNWVIRNFAPPEDLRTDLSKWKAGDVARVRVTLVTADSSRLACASPKTIDGAHCAFSGDHISWPKGPESVVDDNSPDVIQPYRTSPDNLLVLLVGLWAQPEVAMRLHREPPGSVAAAKRLQRFDVTCQVKFLEQLDTVDLRWDVNAAWGTERNAWVGRPVECVVNK